ncbi:Tc toxin subunit A-related protein [Coleofasciculus sp. E2-BRE-01]|uniref:Tc toxin subunit A-related protein n=1 Tax=Coleofasciculus sp. E2-BRE-01 TaxID=3069524 RepID=UPI0032F1B4A7
MPSLLIIRLHPEQPIPGDEFTNFLNGLSIAAHEISFNDPEGSESAFGTATYIAPTLPPFPSPPDPDPNSRITQHFSIIPIEPGVFVRTFAAVATAVIEIPDPPAGGEYRTADVRLVITRNGNEIAHNQIYYNVPVSNAPLPGNPNDFQNLQPVSLHLALTSSAQSSPTVILPQNGAAPNFAALQTAVEEVLNAEPGNLANIATLTLDQCRHIAYEIIWDRQAYPLPTPQRSLEQIYTGPQAADSDDERDRQRFEGELITYYTTHNADADRLTNFVFSLSAAIWCEEQTQQATQAGFYFPVFPNSPGQDIKVILKGSGNATLNPAFAVPADYFYALTAILPPQVKREQRFKMATLDAEAQAIANFEQAIDEHIFTEPPGVNPYQAARRLRALGSAEEIGTAECEVNPGTSVQGLVSHWLAFPDEDINGFWGTLSPTDTTGHLDLVLCGITKAHAPLIAAIEGASFGVNHINHLAAKTTSEWQDLFNSNPTLLPDFTKPGTTEERIQAFIRHLRKFFDVANVFDPPPTPTSEAVPLLNRSPGNPVDQLLTNYPGGFSFSSWDETLLTTTLNGIFPGNPNAQEQFIEWLTCIQGMINLTNGITPIEMQFSVMEALWARGFTSRDVIGTFSNSTDFQEALTGSIAYDYATLIWKNVNPPPSDSPPRSNGFQPVNPDGSLINCIPPAHLSPLGPVAYLSELLNVSENSTCDDPFPVQVQQTLAPLLNSRRGALGDLFATQSNLEVPIPLIDIVNESLEQMVANDVTSGIVYNTAIDQVGGHQLTSNDSPSIDVYQHDPETLLEVLPEHSTPATPTVQQTAYNPLKSDFSTCHLPYSQPLDVARTYLNQLGTSRFATMRHFRQDITEFVLDPTNEPAAFQQHLWRYPVRIETAIEYLKITPEEYTNLFQPEGISAHLLYGFEFPQLDNQQFWIETVTQVSEFLKRTCLTYCEFIDLWKSEFVEFGLQNNREEGFPDCEPCCLDKYIIDFGNPDIEDIALKRLAIFIRLWHKLQAVPNAHYTFTELRDICDVLGLFDGTDVNPDFIRQLVAFQLLRDDFQLSLVDGTPTLPNATGANRLHLLAFWVPGAAKRNWAVEHLLYQIQQYAINVYDCGCREPEFIKLLENNLDAISALAGFNPSNPPDTWHAQPTHTLRLAEILAKIYASEFGVGELLFLFTSENHLQGDDPFPLQTENEAKDFPLSLPDDEEQNSLWALRRKLMAVEISSEAAQQWTWTQMETVLRNEFGFSPAPGNNPWLSLGQHFFPTVLTDSGIPVSLAQRQYRVSLGSTAELMWNTPPDGPFRYDGTAQELWTQIPLTDEAVLAKLSRIRQLSPTEQNAVRDLYFLPRVDLVHFALIFNNFGEAEEQLIQEPDENKRWAWFQSEFARFYQRCQIMAEHLAQHTADITSSPNPEGIELAKLLLKNLWADENRATSPWENDNGQSPSVTWQPQPNGGAFAALLGLTGTGLLAEYFGANTNLRWREVRGGIDAFGSEENANNAPIPTILPQMSFTFSPEQLRFAAVRNGFAMANTDGAMLGGAEPFTLHWHGLLLIENAGEYEFSAGAPTGSGELPDFENIARSHRWRITLKRGQKTWILLAHDWPHEEAPAACSTPITLKKGFYELEIELERKPLVFDGPEDVCPQHTGFQLKYGGSDAGEAWLAIPHDKLFLAQKNTTLRIETIETVQQNFLAVHYISTVRDIRRTYQRVFKAMLLVNRLNLSAHRISDNGQSELGYLLAHPDNFAGQAYYRSGVAFVTHTANFDPNFLPVLDNYYPPSVTPDQRVAPTLQRQQALFDWWERLFDYTVMRRETQRSPEQPVWLLFHESAELHPDNPADLVRHLGIDLRHNTLVLQYYLDYLVTSVDLEDDRWAVRVWQSEKWVRGLLKRFYPQDIREARPDLWASDDPSMPETAFGTTESGNANLTQFYRNGCIENGEPRRYEEIKRLNDALRQRGRAALVAYLTHQNRVPLPWGGFATEAKQLSELLLLDVEVGICQKASRIEEAVSAIHLFVQRTRLGLEPGFIASSDFVLAWERHFASFRVWQACKRRLIYRENWVEWDELQAAQQTEAFQFLESELRRADLTLPIPGGLTYWNSSRPPTHPGITPLQHREPATQQFLNPIPEGLGLMGTPDRHARPTWLAPVRVESQGNPAQDAGEDREGQENENSSDPIVSSAFNPQQHVTEANLPMWLQAAIRLGTKFIRVAAADIPPATTTFEPQCRVSQSSACCSICGKVHPALMDEYYFWIEETRYYAAQEYDAEEGAAEEGAIEQIAEWGTTAENRRQGIEADPQTDWHRPEQLPGLLHWNSQRMVHLRWCRVHNGEFQQPRQSYEGVRLQQETSPELVFSGRSGDSLYFEITGGQAPIGIPAPSQPDQAPAPGFRYDLALDEATVVPQVVTPPAPELIGGLAAFPFFAWFDPGQPLFPPSLFSPAVAVARHLRVHCRFEAALKWYKLVYNPLLNDNTWHICPPDDRGYKEPGTEDCCCPSDPVSDAEVKERAILLQYLDTLLQWGDALMRKNTPEAFQQARLIFDTAAKILGATPTTVLLNGNTQGTFPVFRFQSACAPINPRLMCLYANVSDRLTLIHTCLNAKRLKNGRPNLDMPYFGNSDIRDCWKTSREICTDESEWCLPQSPYRFMVLIQKAQEMAGDVRAFGSALLAAYEKGDAEYLSTMRTMHERQLLNLTLEIRQHQWREADWQIQALRKTKEIAQTRLQYYKNLIAVGLISGEAQYEPRTISSTTTRAAGNVAVALGQTLNLIPDPYVGFPCNQIKLPPGEKLSAIVSAFGTIANTVADILNTIASLGLTKAGWERREQEWKHQVDVLTIEIEQIERQILAAERRRDIALRELNNHQQQIENTAEVHDFLRDKFTNHALYLWMQQETAAMHHQMYELALHCARQAQRAFNFERGHTARQFIPTEMWDNLHAGLLSGERLQLALRHLEKAYYDENVREYELTKHISLRLHFSMAFLQLRTTGYCEIEIPEWMFDLDYPGHYMRRIKNVTMTIPCVVGPYTGVHCRLTLLSSKTRVESKLIAPPHTCCHDERWKNGYQAMPDDPRIVSMYGATEAIATSSGQNDSGMFELNFRDERYLPFEFSGAVSRWRIELPLENNHFDMETLSDIVLHLNFTARDGGEKLRQVANECAQQNLPDAGVRFFDVKREFPEAWHSLVGNGSNVPGDRQLGIRLSRNLFPYLTGNKRIGIQRLEIFFEAPGANPSTHHIVEFWAGQRMSRIREEKCNCNVHSIVCVADAKWPALFHGVLEIDLEIFSQSGYQDLGIFRFPENIGAIANTYLFFGYNLHSADPNSAPWTLD